MKYVVCVPDGCADEPTERLGGRTPLEVADLPTLQGLAARGTVGRAAVIPPGMPPGSDVGNLSILGYDPAAHHTGRAPIEAAALGLRLAPDQVAYRCNLSTVGADGTMVDFAGGHPSTERGGRGHRRPPGRVGRGRDQLPPGRPVPPHRRRPRVLGRRRVCPAPRPERQADRAARPGPAAGEADRGHGRLPGGARALRPRRQPGLALGPGPPAPAAVVPGAPRRRGRAGHRRRPGPWARCPHRHARWSTSRAPPAGTTPTTRASGTPPSTRSPTGPTSSSSTSRPPTRPATPATSTEKVKALENWDRRILPGLVEGLDEMGPWRLLLLPDHATPVDLKTHTSRSGALPPRRLGRRRPGWRRTPSPAWPPPPSSPVTS